MNTKMIVLIFGLMIVVITFFPGLSGYQLNDINFENRIEIISDNIYTINLNNYADGYYEFYEGDHILIQIIVYWVPYNSSKMICLWGDNTTFPEGATLDPECNCSLGETSAILDWHIAIGQAGTHTLLFYCGENCGEPCNGENCVFELTFYVYPMGYNSPIADANGPYFSVINEPVDFIGNVINGSPPYSYFWDFGDGYSSNLQNATHAYQEPGNYSIIFSVTDSNDGPSSTDNDTTWAVIRDNNAPSKPIINGPSEVVMGESYNYSLISIDPEDDEIFFTISTDNSTFYKFGPVSSNEVLEFPFIWEEKGDFTFMAKANDIYDAESDWSYLEVTVPKNIYYNILDLIINLIEKYPLIFNLFTNIFS